ncbi:Hypothetical protein (plasmid) [Pseudomonas putida]|nr:Hypothetical protein [Pseudomonas putida]
MGLIFTAIQPWQNPAPGQLLCYESGEITTPGDGSLFRSSPGH